MTCMDLKTCKTLLNLDPKHVHVSLLVQRETRISGGHLQAGLKKSI